MRAEVRLYQYYDNLQAPQMAFFIVLSCSHPRTLTYYSGQPVPFESDCSNQIRGFLEVYGTLRNHTRFAANSTYLVNSTRAHDASKTYFYVELMRTLQEQGINYNDILTMDMYANLTLNKVKQVVGFYFEEMCSYGAQKFKLAVNNYAYHVFPRNFACAPFNFSDLKPSVYYKRVGLTGENLASNIQADTFYLTFQVGVINGSEWYKAIERAYVYLEFFDIPLTLSRDSEDSSNGVSSPALEFQHCFQRDANIIAHYSDRQLFLYPKEVLDCHLGGKIRWNVSTLQQQELVIQQNGFFEPYFKYQTPVGLNLTDAVLSASKFELELPDGARTVLGTSYVLASLTQVQLCNQDEGQYVVEKLDFNHSAQIYSRSDAYNLCQRLCGAKIRISTNSAQALPFVMLHRRPGFGLLGFDVDAKWLKYDQQDSIELAFSQMRHVPFATPRSMSNCLYVSQYVVARNGKLLLLSKQICSPEKTAISGFAYEAVQNYRNSASADDFDMYFGVTFTPTGGAAISPAQLLDSALSDHFSFSRAVDADPRANIVPFTYVTAEQVSAQLAEIAEYEANNYDYAFWVRSNWWIFFLAIAVFILLGFSLLYGCRYPCLYCLVPSARKNFPRQRSKRSDDEKAGEEAGASAENKKRGPRPVLAMQPM